MMKKIREWWNEQRDRVGLLLLGLVAFGVLYLTKLGSLIPGDSLFEKPGFLRITSAQSMLENVAFGPIKLIQAAMVKIDDPNATLLRLVSAGCVLVAILAFYFVLERWHTRRIAWMGTALFATSTYSLQQGRFAGHEVAYLCVIPLILLVGVWLRSKRHVFKLPLALIITTLLLYVPGVWLLFVVLTIVFRKRLKLAWQFIDKKHRFIGMGAAILIVTPLLCGVIRYPDQIPVILGIDRITDGNAAQVATQFIELPKQLFVTGPDQPIQWLVGTPILDIATVILAVLGMFSYVRGPHPLRARLLGLFIIFGLIVIGTSLNVTVALLLPLAYIFAANGLAYLLQSWFTVFPRNPAARSIGIVFLVVLVALISFYHMNRYYHAWPNSPDTKQALSTRVD